MSKKHRSRPQGLPAGSGWPLGEESLVSLIGDKTLRRIAEPLTSNNKNVQMTRRFEAGTLGIYQGRRAPGAREFLWVDFELPNGKCFPAEVDPADVQAIR